MLRLVAGLSRSLPLLIALIVLALAIYAFVSWRRTPTRAKEILIKVFFVLWQRDNGLLRAGDDLCRAR